MWRIANMTPEPNKRAAGRILICDDETLVAGEIANTLTGLRYEVAGIVSSGEEAVRAAEEAAPDLILMDIKLAGACDAISAAGFIRQRLDLPVIFLTRDADVEVLERAKGAQPYGYITKPVGLFELRNAVETALDKHGSDRLLKRQSALLRAVTEVQDELMSGTDPHHLFDGLLDKLVSLTGSEFGFIDEIFHNGEGLPRRRLRALTNIAWNEETQRFYEEHRSRGIVFYDHGNLAGATMKSGRAVISNDPSNDPRSRGLPAGHPPLKSFLGLPLYFRDKLIGTVGLANRPGGYDEAMAEFLSPFLSACSNIIVWYGEEQDRKRAEQALMEARAEVSVRNRILEVFLTAPDDQVYREALKIVLEFTGSKYGTFGYFRSDGSFVVPFMTREIYWRECQVFEKEIIFQRGAFTGIWARAIEEKKTLYANEGPFNTPEGHIPISNTMATPIIYHGEVISAFHLANKPIGYDESDVRTLDSIARRLAPILNARLERDREEAERKKAEERLKGSLKEKDVLLREIHHRVKNNLAAISSLAGLHADYARDDGARRQFREFEDRVRSMAVAHELLYQSENLAEIDIPTYIQRLVDHLALNSRILGTLIDVEYLVEPCAMNPDTAIPVGFLVNELVSNCLKHAFREKEHGIIRVALHPTGEEEFELVVSDNGVGLPAHIDPSKPQTIGLELVDAFVAQLKGRMEILRENGATVRIIFGSRKTKRAAARDQGDGQDGRPTPVAQTSPG
jgi:two-component sensor histidine kinase/CheY-like chemotaxis protein